MYDSCRGHVTRAEDHQTFKPPATNHTSRVGLGLAETRDAVAVLPLTPFFKDFDALKAFHNVALSTEGGSGAQAAVL